MDFKRIKTIFIVLFTLTNLFLGITIVCSNYEKTTVKEQLIIEVQNILENNNIEVEKSLIPSKRIILPKLATVDNPDLEKKIALSLLGSRYEIKNIDGTETYIYNNNKLVLKYGNLVVFEEENPYLESIEERLALEYTKNFVKNLNQKNSEFFLISLDKTNEGYTFKIGQKYDGVLIDGNELNIYISKKGKMSVNGSFVYTNLMPVEAGILSDPLNAILKFIKYNNTQSTKIVEIEPCYVSATALNTTLTPYYRITNEKGNHYYFDIISGVKK